jgi:hypothetical protein
MNLKESIRRILREEFNPIKARRMIYIADEYISKLTPEDICGHWTEFEADDYMNASMSEITREMIYEYPDMESEEYMDYYDEIYSILLEFKYDEKIRNFFLESLDNCD